MKHISIAMAPHNGGDPREETGKGLHVRLATRKPARKKAKRKVARKTKR